MQKFQRNYKIQFEIGHLADSKADFIPEEIIEIGYPITLHFSVENSPLAMVNTGRFQLYNLSPATQKLLHKDRNDILKYVTMKLYAGYQDTMPCIFWGNFLQCYSTRDSGSVDFITSIEATNLMYMFINGYVNNTYSEGTVPEFLFKDLLMGTVPDVQLGYISKELKPLQSDQTFLGNMYDLIRDEYSNMQVYIDNNQFNVIAEDEVIPGDIQVITSKSGLLSTPVRHDQVFEVESIFEPGLKVGQAVTLLSQTAEHANSTYKIIALNHSGVISPVESSTAITRASLYLGGYNFKQLDQPTQIYGETKTTTTPQPGSLTGWQKPLKSYKITSNYGYRIHPVTKEKKFHSGIDLAADKGIPIYASNNGVVATVGSKGGYGLAVTLNHGKIDNKEMSSLYAHMSSYAVSVNQRVAAGQLIGYVGSTGVSTGNHLHFGIYENNKSVNPTRYVSL